MREAVAQAVANEIVDSPTDAQWDMILSDNPATCVIAGAGSGKSTTLVLRVVLMLEYLDVRRQDMTVVSFTTASCAELRETLTKVLLHWNPRELTEREAKRLVRTFHSALNQVAKVVFPQTRFFENLKEKRKKANAEDRDPALMLEPADTQQAPEDVENPFSAAKLSSQQLELINSSYRELFQIDAEFRTDVLAMLAIECQRSRDDTVETRAYLANTKRVAASRDRNLITTVNAKLAELKMWPEGVTCGPIEAFDYGGHIFHANGVVDSTGKLVFFGGFIGENSLLDSSIMVCGEDGRDEFPVYKVLDMKRNIVSMACGREFIYVNDRESLRKLGLEAQFLGDTWEPGTPAPMFNVQLDGEIKGTSIAEAFYVQASFMENMGMRVSDSIAQMAPFRDSCLEYHFANAISRYWVHFNNALGNQGIMTFNDAFLRLTEGGGPRATRITPQLLAPFLHLVIDEFQDISPQIARWLVALQRKLAVPEIQGRFPSIMAIGDDWQSIYGWRGSAPDFFIKFDSHFPSHTKLGGATVLRMTENFRSVPPIIEDAEVILQPVQNKTTKTSVPTKKAEAGDHGVRLIECGKLDEPVLDQIVQFIERQYLDACRLPNAHKNKVIVMSRKNSVIDQLSTKLGNRRGLLVYTYHRSKGLQAEVAIMVEDCAYEQNHKLRNRVYATTGLFENGYDYDQAMRDEAFRLAYVGATRGRRRTYWFVSELQGAAKQLATSGHNVSGLDDIRTGSAAVSEIKNISERHVA